METTEEIWDEQLDLNLKGYFFMVKTLVPHFRENGGGKVVNISSIAGTGAFPNCPGYCASKGGVVNMTRALAAEPRMIICDEVTSALDQLVAEGILRLLAKLQDELGLAYMFITHDLATVRAIADSVVVMKDGRVVEQGTKEEVFNPPHHPYTDLLLSSVPEMDPDWLDKLLSSRAVDNIGDAAADKISAES